MKTKEREFLLGLTELTRKTGIVIGGCGCCGSPYLSELTPEAAVPEAGYAHNDGGWDPGAKWISPEDAWDWEKRGHKIVR